MFEENASDNQTVTAQEFGLVDKCGRLSTISAKEEIELGKVGTTLTNFRG